jgi:apolipoprotein N-acyltransferase
MVRSANTGVTCFINEFGRVTQILLDSSGSQFTEGVLSGDVQVPIAHQQTFYVRHGEVFGQACTVIAGATLVFLLVRLLIQKKRRA